MKRRHTKECVLLDKNQETMEKVQARERILYEENTYSRMCSLITDVLDTNRGKMETLEVPLIECVLL